MTSYRSKLSKGIGGLAKKADGFISESIKRTLDEWCLGSIKQESTTGDSIIGKGPETARAKQRSGVTVLIVKSPAHAEEFLRLSQRGLQMLLNREKQDFVIAVRKMAEDARSKRFQALKEEIAHLDFTLHPELREEIIEDLDDQSVNIRQVAFHQIKNRVRDSNILFVFPLNEV